MNLQNILNELESVDGEVFDRMAHVSRRNMFNMWANKAAKLAVAGPAVMAAAITNSYGQSGLPQAVVDVLNFALTLEYLEAEFYVRGTETPGLIPSQYMMIFRQIRKHEEAHVRLLRSVLGAQAVAKPTFDFTAKGAFPTVFSDFQTYAALSQAFEDTGVRAYKGQAGNLIAAPAVLEVALNIHSVEARHAARIRALRGFKGWITESDASGLPAAIYANDNITVQLGVELAGIAGKSHAAVTESFDEPLSKNDVLAIAGPFLA
ncbi:ferritin-like domain-containing protein [Fibrella arboris]|uniref:ferritin-like domain-containing protein n=1 Tax=Fibrella arboris TaxID=3242486 RepID=UPI003522E6C8